jgi:hypothetical protein
VLTVDGQHCWIQEPQHPTWSIDTEFYSHKYAKAGLNYELGIAIRDSHLVWMAGPQPLYDVLVDDGILVSWG